VYTKKKKIWASSWLFTAILRSCYELRNRVPNGTQKASQPQH